VPPTPADREARWERAVGADAALVAALSPEPSTASGIGSELTGAASPLDSVPEGAVDLANAEGDGGGAAASGASGASGLPRRFGRNVLMNYVAQAVTGIAALVITPLLLHHLGKSLFGVWILASSVVTYLQLFGAAFGGATTRLVAEDAGHRPHAALRTLNTTFFVLIPLGALALVAGLVIALFFPDIVHVAPALRTSVIVAVAVLAISVAVALPFDTFGGALLGHQRFDLLAISNALLIAITTGASIAIVLLGGGIVALAVATTVLSVAMHGLRYAMVVRIQPGTRLSRSLVDRSQLRRALHMSGWFLSLGVLTAIYNTLCDVLIVGIVAGVRAAAVYAVGSRLAKAAMQALDSLAQVFFPHASDAARNESSGALAAIAVDGTRVTLVGGTLAAIVFAVLAAPGIHAWVGPGYASSARVLAVLAIALALGSPFRALGNIMTGAGDLRALTMVRAGEVVINLVLSIILVLAIGPVGAAFGTLAGVVLFRLPVGMVIGCRAVGIPVRTLVRKSVVPHLLPAAAGVGVMVALIKVAEGSLAGLVGTAVAGSLVYLGLYFFTGATQGDRRRMIGYLESLRSLRGRHRDAELVATRAVPPPEVRTPSE
jgi:O-antigen/teichoic acid export membrane protein